MEAVGRLAGGVAHDFNNLLTVIAGYAEILLRAATAARSSRRSRAPPRQAAALTRQLLAFSRRQVLQPKVARPQRDRRRAWRRCCGGSSATTCSVGIQLAPDLAPVEADRAQIEQVMLNLAANARDAMPRRRRADDRDRATSMLDEQQVARTATGSPGPHVLLAVSDTGIGMDEEVREHLFEPFFTTKAGGDGHRASGWRPCTASSSRAAAGSASTASRAAARRSRSTCPRRRRARERRRAGRRSPSRAAGPRRCSSSRTTTSVRELVRLMLEGNGYEVLSAHDADEAVASAPSTRAASTCC